MLSKNIRSGKRTVNDVMNVLLIFSRGAVMRRKIIKILIYAPKNCNQIAKCLKVNWWTIQKHLQRLEKAGIIKGVNVGRVRYYSLKSNALDDPCRTYFDPNLQKFLNSKPAAVMVKKQQWGEQCGSS
jgi:DNA-binding transcriptional ArsR family regulator